MFNKKTNFYIVLFIILIFSIIIFCYFFFVKKYQSYAGISEEYLVDKTENIDENIIKNIAKTTEETFDNKLENKNLTATEKEKIKQNIFHNLFDNNKDLDAFFEEENLSNNFTEKTLSYIQQELIAQGKNDNQEAIKNKIQELEKELNMQQPVQLIAKTDTVKKTTNTPAFNKLIGSLAGSLANLKEKIIDKSKEQKENVEDKKPNYNENNSNIADNQDQDRVIQKTNEKATNEEPDQEESTNEPPITIEPIIPEKNFFSYCNTTTGKCLITEDQYKDNEECLQKNPSQTKCFPLDGSLCSLSCQKTTDQNIFEKIDQGLEDEAIKIPENKQEQFKKNIKTKIIKELKKEFQEENFDNKEEQKKIEKDLSEDIDRQIKKETQRDSSYYSQIETKVLETLCQNPANKLSIKSWIIYQGFGRVIIKFKEDESDVYNKHYSEKIIKEALNKNKLFIKIGTDEKNLKYQFRFTKNPRSDKFYVAINNIKRNNLWHKNQKKSSAIKYYFRIIANSQESDLFEFNPLNRLGEVLYNQNRFYGFSYDLKKYGAISYGF